MAVKIYSMGLKCNTFSIPSVNSRLYKITSNIFVEIAVIVSKQLVIKV